MSSANTRTNTDDPNLAVAKRRSQPLRFGSRRRLAWELMALVILIAVAAYVRIAPVRAERRLRHATLQELVAAAKSDPNNPRIFYYQGVRCQELGQYGPAYAAFARAAALDNDSEQAWLAWAEIAGRFHNSDEALDILATFLKAHHDSARSHYELALIYQQKSIHVRATMEAYAAAKLDPGNSNYWRLAGIESLNNSDPGHAEAMMRRAVAADPKDWRNEFGLGNVLIQQNRPEEARGDYETAVRLAPDEPLPQMALGDMLRGAKPPDYAAAMQHFQRAVTIAPTMYAAHLVLGQFEIQCGRWSDAMAELLTAERLDPHGIDVHNSLAQVYRHANNTLDADREANILRYLREYETDKLALGSRARASDNAQARLDLARIYVQHGDYSQAADAYRNVLAHTPDMKVAQSELSALVREHPEATPRIALPTDPTSGTAPDLLGDADALLSRRGYAEAERAYRNILARDPNSPAALQGVGLSLVGQGRNDDAFSYLQRAVDLDPTLDKAEYSLARLLYDAGFPDVAGVHLETLVKRVPDNPTYWYALGSCESRYSGRYAQSLEAYQHAASLAPTNAKYIVGLAGAQARLNQGGAEGSFRRALTLAPDDPAVLDGLGSFLTEQTSANSDAEARQLLTKAVAIAPGNAHAWSELGALMLRHDEAGPAADALEHAVKYNPNDVKTWYTLARAYQRLGNSARSSQARATAENLNQYLSALSIGEEQARLHPKDAALRLQLARLYARGKQQAKAINQYLITLKLDPGKRGVKSELKSYERLLIAEGTMPRMKVFNGLLTAAVIRP